MMGGDIEVVSSVGIGSTFTVHLPVSGRDRHRSDRFAVQARLSTAKRDSRPTLYTADH